MSRTCLGGGGVRTGRARHAPLGGMGKRASRTDPLVSWGKGERARTRVANTSSAAGNRLKTATDMHTHTRARVTHLFCEGSSGEHTRHVFSRSLGRGEWEDKGRVRHASLFKREGSRP